ncbi:MAG: four helix bundle protein [Anaerolineales bacterium]
MQKINQPDAKILPGNGQEDRQSYKDLLVWQKGLDLVGQVYFLTGKFPNVETYGSKKVKSRELLFRSLQILPKVRLGERRIRNSAGSFESPSDHW